MSNDEALLELNPVGCWTIDYLNNHGVRASMYEYGMSLEYAIVRMRIYNERGKYKDRNLQIRNLSTGEVIPGELFV